MTDTRLITLDGLQSLVDALLAEGYTVIGPTARSGAIVNAPIRSIDELPRGWGDEQDAARYRLRRRDDEALFGFAAGAQSAKPVFFPTDELLWRGRRTASGSRCAQTRRPTRRTPRLGRPTPSSVSVRATSARSGSTTRC